MSKKFLYLDTDGNLPQSSGGFEISDHISTSAGVPDAGKPVITGAGGKLDYSFLTTPVTSVFGRHGDVVAVDGDYSKSLITGLKNADDVVFASATLSNLIAAQATAVVADTSGKLIKSAVTAAELAFLGGATSNIQDQIDGKAASFSTGNVSETGSSILAFTGAAGAVIGAGLTIAVQKSDATHDGYLSSIDWSAFDKKNTDYFTVGSQAAMLALSAGVGDIAIRTDLSKSYGLASLPASTLSNWKELLSPSSGGFVTSVFGRSAVVVATDGDYSKSLITGLKDTDDVLFNSLSASFFTADTVPYVNSSKKLASSSVTPTELGWLAGVTSAIQTQINSKQDALPTQTGHNGQFLTTDGSILSWGTPTMSVAWGAITGTLSDQTDLATALSGKEPTLTKGSVSELTSSILSFSGNTNAVIGAGLTIAVQKSDATHDGYLSQGDWSTFNSKQAALGFTPENVANKEDTTLDTSTTKYPTNRLAKSYIDTAIGTREPTLTKGDLTELTSSVLTITGGTAAIIGSGLTIQVKKSSGAQSGYLDSADFSSFAAKMAVVGSPTTGDILTTDSGGQAVDSGKKFNDSGATAADIWSGAQVTSAINSAIGGLGNVQVFKGVIDCSANPNYPAATIGWTWKISVAGKIGGASGVVVEVGDTLICTTSNAGGTQAAVGADFYVQQANIDGAVTTAETSSVGYELAFYSGVSGKIIAKSSIVTDASGNMNLPSGAKYKINSTQISAANLSNGTTGSGSVVLSDQPSFSTSMTLVYSAPANFYQYTVSASVSQRSYHALIKTHGGSVGAPVDTINGEYLGTLDYMGVNNAQNFVDSLFVDAIQVGAAGLNVASDLVISTSTSSTGPAETFRILSSKGFLVTGGKGTFAAAVAAYASANFPHGTAPSSPVNGDLWTTTVGIFARINSATVGLAGTGGTLSIGSGGTLGTAAYTDSTAYLAVGGTAVKATNLVGGNSTTLLGSLPYQGGTDTTAMLAPNTSTTKNFLGMTGDGTNGAAPVWTTITPSDAGLGNVTNFEQIEARIGTTKGDLITFSASATPVRIAAGASAGNLRTDGSGNWSIDTTAYATVDSPSFTTQVTLGEGVNLILGTSTGTKIGTSSSQKIGFFGATAVVQPTGSIKTALSNLGLVGSPTISEADFTFTNITTANVSTSAHGLAPILSNNAAQFLNGQGNWTTPTGTANSYKTTSISTTGLTWTVTHNFGAYPVIAVQDSTGAVLIPVSIVHNSLNDFTVTLASSANGGTILATLGGPQAAAVTVISADYTVTYNDYYVSSTAYNIIVTLPTAIGHGGASFVIDNNSTGNIRIYTVPVATTGGTKSSTTVTINQSSHGLTNGQMIMITVSGDTAAIPLGTYDITYINANSFSIQAAAGGAASGLTMTYSYQTILKNLFQVLPSQSSTLVWSDGSNWRV